MQERVQSDITEVFIECKPVERFIINTHAFHNAHLIREVLPQSLTAPIARFQDRRSKHFEVAAKYRTSQNTKRAAQKEKQQKEKEAANGGNNIGSKKRKTASS
jgi:hypothetical protein